MTDTDSPIERCLAQWHAYLASGDREVLDALLDDDVVFISPVVFTPQVGKDVTTLYLTAAGSSLGGSTSSDAPAATAGSDGWDGKFRYVRKVVDGDHAVLEFETTLAGKYVNGVDLITCNPAGRIVEFKVMIRPLQAINAVHEQMKAMLDAMS